MKTKDLTKWLSLYWLYLSLLMIVGQFIRLDIPQEIFLGLSILVYVLVKVIVTYYKVILKGLGICIGLLVALMVFKLVAYQFIDMPWAQWLIHHTDMTGLIDAIRTFYQWLVGEKSLHLMEETHYSLYYESLFFIMVAGLSAIVIGLLQLIRGFKWLLLLPFIVFINLWYRYIDFPYSLYAFYAFAVFIAFVVAVREELSEAHQDFGQSHYQSKGLLVWSMTLGMVVMLVSVICINLLPVTKINQAIDPFMPNLWGARTDFASNPFKMFTLDDTSFQSSYESLGGPIYDIDRETILFELRVNKNQEETLYLKANVKDYYTGKRWESHALDYANGFEYYLDNPDNSRLVEADTPDTISGSIHMAAADTVTLFTPMGLYESSLNPDKLYVSKDNEAYYKSGTFAQFLKDYTFKASGKDYVLDENTDYLQVPDAVDYGVYQLSRNLAQYGKTDYEKMVIMTRFLVQTYDYTLYPPPYLGEREFVSEFIFDTRQGYCTYFASALTIMARINGIPARYVEGFKIEPQDFDEDNHAGVTEGEAHAWTEVYIEDQGWMIFEATPPFAQPQSIILEADTPEDVFDTADQMVLGKSDASTDDFKEALLEAQMVMGEDGQKSSIASNHQSISPKGIVYGLIGLLGLALIAFIGVNLRAFKSDDTIKTLVARIYYLEYLLRHTENQVDGTLESLCRDANISFDLMGRLLYQSPHKISEADRLNLQALLTHEISIQHVRYTKKFGRLSYWVLRGFKMKSIQKAFSRD